MDTMTASPDAAAPRIAGARFDCVRILADDLTGACDSAAPFASNGLGVRVWLGAVGSSDELVQAFNTASRGLEPELAAQAVTAAARIECGPKALWFKKVDSAGRGAIAAELRAAHLALRTRAILFAPSFPDAGRTVSGGVLRIEDAAGVRTIDLMDLLAPDFARVDRVGKACEVASILNGGGLLLVCDAATSDELDDLAALDLPGLLYAGSAGLAKALAGIGMTDTPEAVVPRVNRTMTVCGTPHRATQVQMAHLGEVLPDHPRIQVKSEASDAALIVEEFERYDPEAMILTGGDTALLALTALGADSIALRGELAPGIPWGFVSGGMADGRIVVTKSGGFGDATSLARLVRMLTAERAG